MTFSKTSYQLQSMSTGKIFSDTGWLLDAPDEKSPSLIRAIYKQRQLVVKENGLGLYQFSHWLPIQRTLVGSYAPISYKSEGLAKAL